MARRRRPVYYHGGAPGLGVGDMVRPARDLPVPPVVYLTGEYPGDPGRVYITTDLMAADWYASMYIEGTSTRRPGTTYRVTPLGVMRPDPDFPQSASYFTCDRARVDEVVHEDVARRTELLLHAHRMMTWDDGSPMYDEEGYARAPKVALRAGVEHHELRRLGLLPSFEAINAGCAEILRGRPGL